MTRMKRGISLLLSVLMLVTMLPASAIPVRAEEKSPEVSGTLNEAISYTFDAATGTLTLTGTGSTPEYSYYGYCSPFKDCTTVKHIVVEDGITEIRGHVFYHMTGLESISLPATVTALYLNWFRDSQITKDGFTVAEGNPKFCAVDGSLFDKNQTELVRFVDKSEADYESYIIPDTVKKISLDAFADDVTLDTLTLAGDQLVLDDYAVRGSVVKHLRIQDGVKDLGDYSSVTGLEDTQITIPASVEHIGSQGLLCSDSIRQIEVDTGNITYYDIDGVVIRREDACIVMYPYGKQDTSYTTPEGIKAITFCAIYNNYLEELTLSAEVEKLETSFAGGTKLKTLRVNSPFIQLPDRSDMLDRMGNLQELYAYENSTIKKYLDTSDTSKLSCFVALPDCTLHQADQNRRVQPTCLEDGYDVCGVCGSELYVAALQSLGHDYEEQVVEPTCISGGYTMHECSRCDSSYTSDIVPKLSEHTMLSGITYDAGTNEEVSHCTYENETAFPVAGRLPETEHNYRNNTDETYTISYPGARQIKLVFDGNSCTEADYDKLMFYKESVAPENLLDTKSGNLRNLTAAYDTDTLIIQFTTDGGNNQYGFKVTEAYGVFDGCGYTRRALHAKHTETIYVDTPSTCKIKGTTIYKCSVCGETRTIEKALGEHNYVESARTEGNCQTQGTVTYVCSYCAESKTEDTGFGAHKFKRGICEYCREKHTMGAFSDITVNEIGKLSWNAVENAQQYAVYLCDAADETENYRLLADGLTDTGLDLTSYLTNGKTYYVMLTASAPAYDLKVSNEYPGYSFTYRSHEHTYTSAVTKQATCTEEGEVTYTCTFGDSSYTQKLPKLSHTRMAYIQNAGLSKDGQSGIRCSACGTVLETKSIPRVSGVTLSKSALVYNGKVQRPSVIVRDSKGTVLKKDTDYTITYSKGCKAVGKYTVTVTLKGNYSGTKKCGFSIIPKKTNIAKLTAAKKGFKVSWKKQVSQTTGYELQYSTSKKFTKGVKTVTIKKNKTVAKSILRLAAKKKYYVRIRTYKGKGKTKVTSEWSAVKSITTKK